MAPAGFWVPWPESVSNAVQKAADCETHSPACTALRGSGGWAADRFSAVRLARDHIHRRQVYNLFCFQRRNGANPQLRCSSEPISGRGPLSAEFPRGWPKCLIWRPVDIPETRAYTSTKLGDRGRKSWGRCPGRTAIQRRENLVTKE